MSGVCEGPEESRPTKGTHTPGNGPNCGAVIPRACGSQKGEKKGEQWQLVEVAKVNHDWPTAPEFVEALHLQRPLGALDLVGSRQGIGEDIVPTHDELRGQNCVVRPRPMKNPQRNLVEKCRISPPPPPHPTPELRR